jgi:predicted nucleic acid-binding protein
MRNILTGYHRDGSLSRAQAARVMDAIEQALSGCEHLVSSAEVFRIVERSRLSVYDGEFVALAAALAVPLVTADKAVLSAFPDVALSMDAFLAA